jgi:hypothetical protein
MAEITTKEQVQQYLAVVILVALAEVLQKMLTLEQVAVALVLQDKEIEAVALLQTVALAAVAAVALER